MKLKEPGDKVQQESGPYCGVCDCHYSIDDDHCPDCGPVLFWYEGGKPSE